MSSSVFIQRRRGPFQLLSMPWKTIQIIFILKNYYFSPNINRSVIKNNSVCAISIVIWSKFREYRHDDHRQDALHFNSPRRKPNERRTVSKLHRTCSKILPCRPTRRLDPGNLWTICRPVRNRRDTNMDCNNLGCDRLWLW